MDIDELRWFEAVAAEPNLTRTAARLHISQPALSRSLQRLETTLGVELFDRVGRSLALNENGRLFADHIRRALEEFDAGRAAVRRASSPDTGVIRLAFLHTLGTWLVPELIRAYRARFEDVVFRLRQAPAGAMIEDLLAGRHDLVLTSPAPNDDRLRWRALFQEPLRLAVPPGHRLARRRRVGLADVADEPFVVLKPEYGLRAITDQLCARVGFVPPVAFEGDDVETLRGLVAAGLGVALLPHRGATTAATPMIAVADRGCVRTICLAWHGERYRSPAVRAFARFVEDHDRALWNGNAPVRD